MRRAAPPSRTYRALACRSTAHQRNYGLHRLCAPHRSSSTSSARSPPAAGVHVKQDGEWKRIVAVRGVDLAVVESKRSLPARNRIFSRPRSLCAIQALERKSRSLLVSMLRYGSSCAPCVRSQTSSRSSTAPPATSTSGAGLRVSGLFPPSPRPSLVTPHMAPLCVLCGV